MPQAPHPLVAEVDEAIEKEIRTNGPDFNQARLKERFIRKGVSDTTCRRRIAAVKARLERENFFGPGSANIDPVAAVEEAVAELPRRVAPPTGRRVSRAAVVPVYEKILETIQAINDVMKFARNPDGAVRNAKILLQASNNLRQCIGEARRINEQLLEKEELDSFHDAMLAVLDEFQPGARDEVLRRWSAMVADARA
jgi:hypothetical protein